MHQKTKKSAFVGEALTEKGKIMQESSARESNVRFPGEESGTKEGLRRNRARHAPAPLWRKAQSVIAPPERKARRENTLPMRKSGARRILRRMSTVRKQTFRQERNKLRNIFCRDAYLRGREKRETAIPFGRIAHLRPRSICSAVPPLHSFCRSADAQSEFFRLRERLRFVAVTHVCSFRRSAVLPTYRRGGSSRYRTFI